MIDEQRKIVTDSMWVIRSVMAGMRVTDDEAYSVGCEGLCYAVEKYDASKGVKWSTFAYTVVKNRIIDYLRKEKRINKTVNIDEIASPQDEEENEFYNYVYALADETEKIIIDMIGKGYTQSEIGKAIGKSHTFVYKKLKEIGKWALE